ncbi:hypothetical protein B0H12DRAFT_574169 [Mycena haematopus]|nr:hypothetical protein B0H12DRAFT_574169 [Mycena haematopus]
MKVTRHAGQVDAELGASAHGVSWPSLDLGYVTAPEFTRWAVLYRSDRSRNAVGQALQSRPTTGIPVPALPLTTPRLHVRSIAWLSRTVTRSELLSSQIAVSSFRDSPSSRRLNAFVLVSPASQTRPQCLQQQQHHALGPSFEFEPFVRASLAFISQLNSRTARRLPPRLSAQLPSRPTPAPTARP